MTVIVAVRDQAGVVIGADSRTSHGWYGASSHALPKIIAHRSAGRSVFIGPAGNVRFSNILRYATLPDDLSPSRDEHQWAVTSLVPALRAASAAAGWTEKKNDREDHAGDLLLVIGTRIFNLDCDWAVWEPATPFAAAGSGSDIALGALDAMHRLTPELPGEAMALAALEAACAHNSGCAPPLIVQRRSP